MARNSVRDGLKVRIREEATRLGVVIDAEATCEDLQIELESLQEALQNAPPDRKPALIRRIDKILDQMDQLGC